MGNRTFITLKSGDEIDGFIALSPHWKELDAIARLDLLQDWRSVLEELEDQTRAAHRKRPHELHLVCNSAIKGDKGLGSI